MQKIPLRIFMFLLIVLARLAPRAVAQSPVPPKVQIAVEGYRRNLAGIRSFQTSGRIGCRDVLLKGRDRDGNSVNSHSATVTCYESGDKIRVDASWDRVFDGSTQDVVYAVPHNKFFVKDTLENRLAVMKQYGVCQSTESLLVSGDRTYELSVEQAVLLVSRSRPRLPTQVEPEATWLLEPRLIANMRWNDYVDELSAQKNFVSASVKDVGPENLTITLIWHNPEDGVGPPSGRADLSINPMQGYSLTSLRSTRGGIIEDDVSARYKNCLGHWMLTWARHQSDPKLSGTFTRTVEIEANEASIQLDAGIDGHIFDVDGLPIPKGALISDNITGSTGVYDDAPSYLKLALAKAQANSLAKPIGVVDGQIVDDATFANALNAHVHPTIAIVPQSPSKYNWVVAVCCVIFFALCSITVLYLRRRSSC